MYYLDTPEITVSMDTEVLYDKYMYPLCIHEFNTFLPFVKIQSVRQIDFVSKNKLSYNIFFFVVQNNAVVQMFIVIHPHF